MQETPTEKLTMIVKVSALILEEFDDTGYSEFYFEDKQTTQWPKEKVQKYKQRSTKHTYKSKYRVRQTSLKTGGELRCSGRVSSSCSTSGTRQEVN